MQLNVYSVSQVNTYIKDMFRKDVFLSRVCVRGEISNCKYHSSGHIYFTLKEGSVSGAGFEAGASSYGSGISALSCIMFASRRSGLKFELRDGQNVKVTGSVNVYERDGKYSLYADSIEFDGKGDLYQRYLEIKEQLEEMGMFSEIYKKPIPKYCRKVGIVTARTGAAVQDIIQIATRRNPHVELFLYPALVQGDGAAQSVAAGIQRLDAMGMDCIIVGRGGGSIEDLWAFNEVVVAEAIFAAQTPIISAVGHQTDFTIADFVADLRAPTPSAAAELAVFDWNDFLELLEGYRCDLESRMDRKILNCKHSLNEKYLSLKAQHPGKILERRKDSLKHIREMLDQIMNAQIRQFHLDLKRKDDGIRTQISRSVDQTKYRLSLLSRTLDEASPLKKIAAGYTYAADADGHGIKSINRIKTGDLVDLYFIDGNAKAQIKETQRRSQHDDTGNIE